MTATVWTALLGVANEHDLEPIRLNVTMADDVWAEVEGAYERLDLGHDRRDGPERLGGTVAGKSLVNDRTRRAEIVVSADFLRSPDPSWLYRSAGVFAHECWHVIYATARTAAIGETPGGWLPWDVARIVTNIAAEEYRVEILAQLVVDSMFTARIDDEVVPYRTLFGEPVRQGASDAVERFSELAIATVDDYRINGGDDRLMSMWSKIALLSEDLTKAIAIGDANCPPDHRGVLDHPPARGLGTHLDLLWTPFIDHLRTTPVLPTKDHWEQDRTALSEIGLTLWTDIWELVALTATPSGDSFHLSVVGPQITM